MSDRRATDPDGRQPYAAPQIVSAYSKAEIADLIRPHGPAPTYGGMTVVEPPG